MLRTGAGVEAHYEVVADIVRRLQLLRGLGQEESAPVGDAADDAVLLEDDLAGRLCDSASAGQRVQLEGARGGPWEEERGWLLFDFGEAARAHLQLSVPSSHHVQSQAGDAHHSDHFIEHLGGRDWRCGLG